MPNKSQNKPIMKKHENMNAVALMWVGNTINFNVRKGVDFNIGDIVFVGKSNGGKNVYYQVDEILETRQSTLTDYDYVKTNSTRIIQ